MSALISKRAVLVTSIIRSTRARSYHSLRNARQNPLGKTTLHDTSAQNAHLWNDHKSYRFTLPQALFKTRTVVEGLDSLLKAAIYAPSTALLHKPGEGFMSWIQRGSCDA
jgi:hypothetical protein